MTRINGLDLDRVSEAELIYGIEWAQGESSSPILRHIDINGRSLPLTVHDFDAHPIWGSIRRCTMATDGSINHYGSNPRGDGLDLTGADGRVMTEIPKYYVKSLSPRANVYRWWISEVPKVGFVVHPAFVQRGGIERDYIYLAAYEADLEYNGAAEAYNAAHKELHSRTGKQPMTSEQIWEVQFDGGQNEPAIGDDVGTASDDNFFIIDYLVTGGAWVTNDATGYLWLRKPGDATCGWVDNEQINNNTQVNILADAGAGLGVNGVPVALPLKISDARTLASNIGARWGLMNIWSLAAIQLLYYIEYANANSQTAIGRGIVDKVAGVGFAGEVSGYDSCDTNIGVNGTGAGTGTDGLTPVCYRGIENLWGNVWEFIDGYNAIDGDVPATDVIYQIAKRDGTTIFIDDIDSIAGNYEQSINYTNPVADGYISNIAYEDLLKFAFIPSAIAGSSTTYFCDYLYVHDAGEVNLLLSSDHWSNNDRAGVASRLSSHVTAFSARSIGAHLEYV